MMKCKRVSSGLNSIHWFTCINSVVYKLNIKYPGDAFVFGIHINMDINTLREGYRCLLCVRRGKNVRIALSSGANSWWSLLRNPLVWSLLSTLKCCSKLFRIYYDLKCGIVACVCIYICMYINDNHVYIRFFLKVPTMHYSFIITEQNSLSKNRY